MFTLRLERRAERRCIGELYAQVLAEPLGASALREQLTLTLKRLIAPPRDGGEALEATLKVSSGDHRLSHPS
jgi:hypothetical protein